MTKLYIVRHPQAMGNAQRIFQGYYNAEVSEMGEKQLEALAERFKDIQFDVIYTSPLLRAVKTAKAVNKYHNAEIIEYKGIIEINGGDIEAKPWSYFEETYPEKYNEWKNEPHKFVAPNGESMLEVYNRAKASIEDIVKQNQGKTVVLTSHGCTIRNMFCVLKGLNIENLNDVNWVENTGVTLVEIENDRVEFIFENDLEHLPCEIRPIKRNTKEYDWRK